MTLSIRTQAEPIDPALIPDIVSEIDTELYFAVAIATLLVYDIIIMMDKEVRYFWKGLPRNLVALVYFVIRYVGVVGAVAHLLGSIYSANLPLCNFSNWGFNGANWFIVISIDYILMIRVLALHSQDKKLAIILQILLALEAAYKLGFLVYLILTEDVTIGGLARGTTICQTNNHVPPSLGIADWTIPLVYGLILMSLAFYKAAEYWRMSAGFSGFTLVKVLIQDQVIYFLLVITCCIFNIMYYKIIVESELLSALLEQLGNPSLFCVLGSRMLIHLKEAGERGLNEGTSYRRDSVSDIEFHQPGRNGGSTETV